MSVEVKICGLKDEAPLKAAIKAGADYVGFVHFKRSPRHVEPERAADLIRLCSGRVKTVCLLVDPSDDELCKVIATANPDLIQLHGDESPDRVAFLRKLSGKPVIKALGVSDKEDVASAADYEGVADLILFDAKTPQNAGNELPGGNGIAFNWQILTGIHPNQQFMLSGGLNPDNVASAIRLTKPAVVDVSTGVESAPGLKDPELIRQFIREVRNADRTAKEV